MFQSGVADPRAGKVQVLELAEPSEMLQPGVRDFGVLDSQPLELAQRFELCQSCIGDFALVQRQLSELAQLRDILESTSVTFVPERSTLRTLSKKTLSTSFRSHAGRLDALESQNTCPPNFSIAFAASRCRSACRIFTASQLHARAQTVTNTSSVRRLYWNHRRLGLMAVISGPAEKWWAGAALARACPTLRVYLVDSKIQRPQRRGVSWASLGTSLVMAVALLLQ